MEKKEITHYIKSQQCNHNSAKYLKAARTCLVLDFAHGTVKNGAYTHQTCSCRELDPCTDGLMIWAFGERTERGREDVGLDVSDTTFPLTCQYYLRFLWPLPDNQWSTRNMQKFVCNLGNTTEALGLCTNALLCLEVHRISLWFPGWMYIRRVPAQISIEEKWDQLFGSSGSQIRSSQICTFQSKVLCTVQIKSEVSLKQNLQWNREFLSLQPAAYPLSCAPCYSCNTMPTHIPNPSFSVTLVFYGPS